MTPNTKIRVAACTSEIRNLIRDENWNDHVAEILLSFARSQDRDTRHACAEAVAAVYTGELVMSKVEIVNAAHQACMNARSV